MQLTADSLTNVQKVLNNPFAKEVIKLKTNTYCEKELPSEHLLGKDLGDWNTKSLKECPSFRNGDEYLLSTKEVENIGRLLPHTAVSVCSGVFPLSFHSHVGSQIIFSRKLLHLGFKNVRLVEVWVEENISHLHSTTRTLAALGPCSIIAKMLAQFLLLSKLSIFLLKKSLMLEIFCSRVAVKCIFSFWNDKNRWILKGERAPSPHPSFQNNPFASCHGCCQLWGKWEGRPGSFYLIFSSLCH